MEPEWRKRVQAGERLVVSLGFFFAGLPLLLKALLRLLKALLRLLAGTTRRRAFWGVMLLRGDGKISWSLLWARDEEVLGVGRSSSLM